MITNCSPEKKEEVIMTEEEPRTERRCYWEKKKLCRKCLKYEKLNFDKKYADSEMS